jgi:hypothetical protein
MSDVYRVVEANGEVSRRSYNSAGTERLFSTLRGAKMARPHAATRGAKIQVARDVQWEDLDS